MFIPLHDANTLKHIRVQYVTIGLIALNTVIWAFTAVAPEMVGELAALGLGFIPAVVYDHAYLDPGLVLVPESLTYLTYAFLHLDIWHLASNMLFLWVFGDNVEDALGHWRFLVFYLLCAAAGAMLHAVIAPVSEGPLIGASGAISGVVAAYLMLHPRVRLWVLVLFRIPLPLPAFIPLTLWLLQQFAMLALDMEGMVSWSAHVGGILAGAILVIFFRRKGVPLFDRQVVLPKAMETRTSVPSAGSRPRQTDVIGI
ncbi:rhomboid family intramembrane serine protease [Pseudorhizobium endolithicum]|uniref:Rhomboid family intramembrane serine protease n=1 Tax=Pseudorhizobium endolithicum TaxID=1191678 RepID=A0ABN7JJV2_9HYPH|nr:rhomboid family intramembrane serine protease [Pseudorhizobium endolithicum]CAD7034725.1 rhomboid family intramembrane serine protease [Pseudorhizobium endolithicum]